MKRLFTVLVLLMLPFLSSGQEYQHHRNSFFSVSTEVDVMNVLDMGRGINGYNGVLNLNYRNSVAEFGLSYETFPNIGFKSYGAGASYIVNPTSRLNALIGFRLSLIYRDLEGLERGHDPSVAGNLQTEYHFKDVFIFLRGEIRHRGDLAAINEDFDPWVSSSFLGVGYKF